MIPLSATLEAHAKASRRQPSLRAFLHPRRGTLTLLRWDRLYTGAEPDSPHTATLAPDGSLIRARNQAGTLYTARVPNPAPGATFSSWTSLTTGLLSGSGIALAQKPGELLLAYTTGTALVVRTSTNNGSSWSAPTTVTTEASNIGSIAAAYGTSGNPCLFYTLGTSTTLKRLRRTAGVWAASGTTWTRSTSVASLTGLSATYLLGDFHLLITGTEATTTHKRAWGAVMGDGAFPANSWSTLVPAAEADTSSTVTFAGPSIATHGTLLRATFARREAGNVPANRAMETATPQPFIGATSAWTEPTPHEATTAYGLALALGSAAWATTPAGVWHAQLPDPLDLTDRLLTARYRISATGSRCAIELDNTAGALTPEHLLVGATIELQPGYRSAPDGSPETALLPRFLLQRVTYRQEGSRRTALLEAASALEVLASWRAPQAWQSPPGTRTRAQLAAAIAARAGFELTLHNTGTEWNQTPSFALALGESAASALARLTAVTAAGIVGAESDGLIARGFAAGDPSTYSYGPGAHPVSSLELTDQPPPANWLRLQGADRYAETADFPSVYQHGPQLRPVRSLDATSDAIANAAATAARRRDAWAQELGQLIAPFQPGTQLFDVVTVNGSAYRVLAHSLDYRRGPQGARYDTTLHLGAL